MAIFRMTALGFWEDLGWVLDNPFTALGSFADWFGQNGEAAVVSFGENWWNTAGNAVRAGELTPM